MDIRSGDNSKVTRIVLMHKTTTLYLLPILVDAHHTAARWRNSCRVNHASSICFWWLVEPIEATWVGRL
jgi:hypothetical protein